MHDAEVGGRKFAQSALALHARQRCLGRFIITCLSSHHLVIVCIGLLFLPFYA